MIGPPDLAIFDFDGTLVDSEAGILSCIEKTVAALTLPAAAVGAWRDMIGLPLAVQLARLLPESRQSEVAAGVELYRTFYNALGDADLGLPFAGVPELVADLRGRRRLAIATSKSRHGVTRSLERLGWLGAFDPVVTPDTVTHPKPHPESLQVCLAHHGAAAAAAVYVGDSRFDMAMAVAAGVRGWGAAWGLHGETELVSAGAARCFSTPRELHEALVAG